MTGAYTKDNISGNIYLQLGLVLLSMVTVMVIFLPRIAAAQTESVMGQETDVMTEEVIDTRTPGSQDKSANIGSVISFNQVDRFADYTVEDAMVRISGVQVDRHGRINLRGVGPDRYNVTVDGQRIGTTGAGDRRFDLGSISADMVRDIEVIKVLTPDKYADALSGSINLVTRLEPGGPRQLNARLGGGGDTRYFPYTGSSNRASLSYSEALREDLTLAVNVSHMVDQRGWESLDVDYEVADFGTGPVDVIERVSPGLHTNGSNRTGGGLQLIFQPSEQVTWHVRGMINTNNRERITHKESSSVNGDWLRPDTTGAAGSRGTHAYDMRLWDSEIRQYAIQAGARHLFDGFNLEYKVGWAQSRFEQEEYLFPFMAGGLDYTINMEDRTRPTMQPTNISLMYDGTIDRREFSLQNIDRILKEHGDSRFSGRVDAEIPFGPATFKLGSSALLTYKDNNFDASNYRYSATTLNRFTVKGQEGIKIFNEEKYNIPRLNDASHTNSFFANNFPMMRWDRDHHHIHSEYLNHSASEHTFAGYGMATVDLTDGLTVIGGARLEYADNQYDGRKVEQDFIGRFNQAVDTTQATDYWHLFPNAQLLFSPLAEVNIRLAYSKTIARPDFNHLAPFEHTNIQDTTVFRGNPHLDPVTSDNLDLMVDYYFGNTGIFSIGLFHKQLSGFVFEKKGKIDIEKGDFTSLDKFFRDDEDLAVLSVHERTFENSDETAAIYGAEVSWQQYLDFFPGFLSNLGVYANYTWSRSVYDVSWRDEEVRLPGQSPHVVNAALDYTQNRFSARVSWHWTAEALTHLQGIPRLAPTIDPNEAVYVDYYEDGWTDVSASLRFRISGNFGFWADARNLLGGVDRIEYANSRTFYPVGIDRREGVNVTMGIRYSL